VVHADDVNILDGSVHTVKKNAISLVVASHEIGLEVNANNTKYTVMSRDLDEVRSLKTDGSSFEMVDEFRYLGTI
jgi:hypothetical protein